MSIAKQREEMMAYGRFGYTPGKFRGCTFCGGDGCPSCDDQAKRQFPAFKEREDAEYARLFPDGPVPLATYKLDSPSDMEEMRRVFGRESLVNAFSPSGGGMPEILEKLARGKCNG